MDERAWLRTNFSDVIKAFKNAPVRNPDGKSGINLHIIVSEEITAIKGKTVSLKEVVGQSKTKAIKYGGKSYACGTGWFGSKEQRNAKNCKAISNARKKVFHYGVFGYKLPGSQGKWGVLLRSEAMIFM